MLVSNSLKRVSAGIRTPNTRRVESWLGFRSVVNAHRRQQSTNSSEASEAFDELEDHLSHRTSSARISGFTGELGPQANKTTRGKMIMELVEKARFARFKDCLEVANKMKAAGMAPDVITYNALLESTVKSPSLLMDSWAIFEDMLASGVKPNIRTMNNLLKAQAKYLSPYFWLVLQKLNARDIRPDAATFSIISSYFLDAGNFEMALQWLYMSNAYGFVPEFDVTQSVIASAAKRGYPRLAIDLIDWYEELSVRRVDKETWMTCLISSAEALYGEGTQRAWTAAIRDHHQLPWEGLCTSVLDTAARCGLPDLVVDVVENLHTRGINLEENHAAAFLEAYIKKGGIKEGLKALPHIEELLGCELRPETYYIFADHLKTTEAIDQCWSMLDGLQIAEGTIHPIIPTALIKASVNLGDVVRAIGIYKALPDYKVAPNITMLNFLLEGCVKTRHRKLGDSLLSDMRKADVRINVDTYKHFISLCLTQENYEDAFWYLEEMKGAGIKPPRSVYVELINTLIEHQDARYKTAFQDMQKEGYPPSSTLRKKIDRAETFRFANPPSRSQGHSLDGAALRFIESGGLQGTAKLAEESSS